MRAPPKLLWTSAAAIVFFVAHVVFLPATLEDIDSLNFALGLHDFDPAKHQPHPPGYPVFIALAKMVRAVWPSDAAALAFLGALGGALALFPLRRIYEDLEALDGWRDARQAPVAALAVMVTMASPLFWFNAGRPMSDVPGLAFTLAAQATLVSAFVRQRLRPERTPEALAATGSRIVLGAFLSALAIGMRSQALWLTLPLLALVLIQRAGRGAAGALLGSLMAFSIGTLLWAVPLVIASGGVRAYWNAVAVQGSEDFVGVDMLYLNPTPRRLAFALLETFIYPWASSALGWTVFALAVVGSLALLKRSPRTLVLLVVLAGPYVCVHLLFQETVTTRYALPLIPVMAYLAIKGLELAAGAARRSATVVTMATAGLVVWSLILTLPAVRVYASEGSPAFRAIAELHKRLAADQGAVVGMHHALLRSVQTQSFEGTRVLNAPPMREWLELVDYWRAGHTQPVWFLADPARTDIELVDPLSRKGAARYSWGFPRERFIGGVRPDVVDLVRIDPPGWFAEEGWHLTSETLNRSVGLRRNRGVAYIRGRPDAALLLIGAESVGEAAEVQVALNDRQIATLEVPKLGRAFQRVELPAGALSGSVLNRLVAAYRTSDGNTGAVRLTELAVASSNDVFFVQHEGWNELEYSRQLQRRWRWTTARAETFINSGGRDVTLTIAGESPLRYFDSPPNVSIRAGAWVVATAAPSEDFELKIHLPAAALDAANGLVTVETDKFFSPAERTGSQDRRILGLRIFRFEVQ